MLHTLHLSVTGANQSHVATHIQRSELDRAHWLGPGWRAGVHRPAVQARPLSAILSNGSGYANRRVLERRLVSAGEMAYRCAGCGISESCGQRLSLILDHVDGNARNCERATPRLLCPSCDSLTPTFAGRSKGAAKRWLGR